VEDEIARSGVSGEAGLEVRDRGRLREKYSHRAYEHAITCHQIKSLHPIQWSPSVLGSASMHKMNRLSTNLHISLTSSSKPLKYSQNVKTNAATAIVA
jgi:hypothetical protein